MVEKVVLRKNVAQFEELIKGIAKGEKSALERFYAVYGQMIYTAAITAAKSSVLADETVNDVLLKVYISAPTIKKIKNPEAWIYSLAVNCAKDKVRYEKSFAEVFDICTEDGKYEETIEKEQFYCDIAALNDIERQILILKFIQDLTFGQIGANIGKSSGYVSATYYRALDKLKETTFKEL